MIYLVSNEINVFNNNFKYINVDEALNLIKDLKYVGVDTETTGLDCHTKNLLTLQLGCWDFQIVFDLTSFNNKIPKKIHKFLSDSDQTFILQNAKFDLKFFYKQNLILNNIYDTFLAEQIITHGSQYGGRALDALVNKYYPDEIGLDKSIRDDIITKGLNSEVIIYAANDVKYLEGIMHKQLKTAEYLDLLQAINLDNLFVKVLAYIEFVGIKLDWSKWKLKTDKNIENLIERKALLDKWVIENGYTKYSEGMTDMFSNNLTCSINWDSSKQVIPLFEEIGIKCELKEKGVTRKSIDAKKVLALQKNDFPILPLYLDYKESSAQINTFGYNWEKFINPSTNRIHSIFRQIMDTGRLSSGEKANKKKGTVGAPNLQNIPADEETRSCFIAEKGNKLIAADYSSQEQRILANFSKVETLINFYKKGLTDMHSYVAFLMYPHIRPCSLEEITNDTLIYIKNNFKHERNLAKNAGFAINYGGDGSTISKNCGIPRKQGNFVYEAYFEAFGGLKEYFKYVLEKTKYNSYINFNHITRRKFFIPVNNPLVAYKNIINTSEIYQMSNPDKIEKEYSLAEAEYAKLAQNYPIQGTAADMTKLACIIFFNALKKRDLLFKVKIVNIVHDEIVIEAPAEIAEDMADLLVKAMAKAGDRFCEIIPLTADAEIGDYWIH